MAYQTENPIPVIADEMAQHPISRELGLSAWQIDEIDGAMPSPDEQWLKENVPQIDTMHEQVTDSSLESAGAELLVKMMTEFAYDGEAFQPSVDKKLKKFIKDVLQREINGISQEQIDALIDSIKDFPPVKSKHP